MRDNIFNPQLSSCISCWTVFLAFPVFPVFPVVFAFAVFPVCFVGCEDTLENCGTCSDADTCTSCAYGYALSDDGLECLGKNVVYIVSVRKVVSLIIE